MSGGLRLPAATHRGLTSGKHLLELEPALRPLLTCTCSPQRMIRAFGRFAGKWWLHQLGGYQQREQLVGAMCIFRGLRVMGVRSCRWREDELNPTTVAIYYVLLPLRYLAAVWPSRRPGSRRAQAVQYYHRSCPWGQSSAWSLLNFPRAALPNLPISLKRRNTRDTLQTASRK